MQVLTGDDVMIGGFIIGGSSPKTVVVRARGPSLAALGVPGTLANPLLQLLGCAVSFKLGLKRALSVGLATGNCNMGLLLAALPPDGDPGVALFFALAQLPMYTLPLVQKRLYSHWMSARNH